MNNLPATRPESINNTGELIQLVSFKLDNEEYGIEALKVREIIRMIPINPEAIGFGPQAILNDTVRSPETPEVARSITLITKGAPSAKVQKLIDFIKSEGKNFIKE